MDKAGEGDAELKGEEKLKIRKNEKEKVTEKRKKKKEKGRVLRTFHTLTHLPIRGNG
jgi:hypothetical protein